MGGLLGEKLLQNLGIFSVCVSLFFVAFLEYFFDQNSYLSVTHRFTSIKLTFAHLQVLFSSHLRRLKRGNMHLAVHFGVLAREWCTFYKRNSMVF